MRSRTGNSLSTLMFLVPLLGVPLMAIFGVPQFVPVIASSVSDDATRPVGLKPKQRFGESAAATSFVADSSPRGTEPQVQDFFRPRARPRHDSRPIQDPVSLESEPKIVETSLNTDGWLTKASSPETADAPSAKLNDLFATTTSVAHRTELRSQDRSDMARLRSEQVATRPTAARFAANTEPTTEGLTWREAVRRLNELGIQEFRLEPGSRLGEFYFVCEFSPHRDARVTRRFEAEATEPLLAVHAVLRQIDDWLSRR